MSRPRAVLVGPPGAGKSTIGRVLARRWGVAFRDTDADVETASGKEVADIFLLDGESAFRDLERAAVATAIAEHEGVLSLGGGAILDVQTRTLLTNHTVVFLDVTIEAAVKRVGMARDRPLLLGNPRVQLGLLMKERKPLYADVATLTVDTSGRSPDEVVNTIVEALA
ncbi:MAG: shikimate kinase [Frankiaceae bacterium]|nr:shikimate kinase [Frankiaceae bacterium]